MDRQAAPPKKSWVILGGVSDIVAEVAQNNSIFGITTQLS